MDTTHFADAIRTEQTTRFIDAIIPKFMEFNLEFSLAYWRTNVLDIQLWDHIAEETIVVTIDEKDFIRWTQAQTSRAAEYYLNLIMIEVIAGMPGPTEEEWEDLIAFDIKDDVFFM